MMDQPLRLRVWNHTQPLWVVPRDFADAIEQMTAAVTRHMAQDGVECEPLGINLVDVERQCTLIRLEYEGDGIDDSSRLTHERYCRVCGCSDYDACDPGCSWVQVLAGQFPLCSACAGKEGE